ncbi:uncharacterized protein LOC141900899 [Tubulanus polymorphus]|uniref:uncharacterized protein LOC141900899 n=1 Tax=Tubulanus polymorphus TaxID=672921 RepID=UPI003DA65278
MSKVALVTGGNKGIGLCIVELLCKQLGKDWSVYLTARNEDLGKEAVKTLAAKGLQPKFHQLDITSSESISNLASYLKKEYDGLDILVNNAGIAFKAASTAPFSEQAAVTNKTNVTGTLNVCNSLFPLLRPHARVVNVSSMVTRFALEKCSPQIRQRYNNLKTIPELEQFVNEFIELAQSNTHKEKGFPDSAYGISKMAVTKMTFIHQAEFDKDSREDVIVNACCPGYCDTDMTSHKGPKSAMDGKLSLSKTHIGADTPVYLALLPPGTSSPKGQHVEDRKIFTIQPIMSKVAVVTGGNKGIGLCIVELLCKQLGKDWSVYLTARNEDLGKEAVKTLAAKGLQPKFHQLDISSSESINNLASYLKKEYDGLDILVNNAGIAFKAASTAPFSEQAAVTNKTNVTGTLNVCNSLFPLLRPHARVVNVSSMVTRFALEKCSPQIRQRYNNLKTIPELEQFVNEFIELAQSNTHKEKGFPDSAYGISKMAVTKMTFIHQAEFDKDSREDVIVNACCPGYCDTDMTSNSGLKSPMDGADTPVYLALLPPGTSSPKGQHVEDRKIFTIQ